MTSARLDDLSPELARWLARCPADAASGSPGAARGAEGGDGQAPDQVLDRLWRAVSAAPEPADALRWAYRAELARIATDDVTAADPLAILPDIMARLTDLADGVVECAYRVACRAEPQADAVRLGIVALGKAGARELNYVSDVDVLYVVEPAPSATGPTLDATEAVTVGTRIVTHLTALVSAYTAAGSIWDLDAGLRPEGNAGPLVRTLAGMRTYYTRWASNWEFQAMLKARPMAGDLDLARAFCDLVGPLVWGAAEREGFVADAQAMRARVVALIPADERGRDIKLGTGGLRDTEFAVQLLQLVHGRADERLRAPNTLAALDALTAHGYVGRADGAALAGAYRFQRLLEHRIQLAAMKRTHLMPTDEVGLRRLARGVGLPDGAAVVKAWRASAATVQRLHHRLYYSPLLEAVARIPSAEVRLTTEAAATRLHALGYADPNAALRHIEALTSGFSRRAEMLRQLLPAMLGWIAAGPNPDMGLLAFRQVAEALGTTPWFLRALRDEGQVAQELAVILSTSRYAGGLLQRSPTSVEMLRDAGTTALTTPDALASEMAGIIARYGAGDQAADLVRAIRRRELLRIAMAHILDHVDVTAVGRALSDLTDATLGAMLAIAQAELGGPTLTVVALGRWGGQELSYASDADLMVVAEDTDDPADVRTAGRVLARLTALLTTSGPDPDLAIDTRLRPEGREGPAVRTYASYVSYYAGWSATWEAQALLRARVGAGDRALGERFLDAIAAVRYPPGGPTPTQVMDIRRLKVRMETERLGRGVEPTSHVKLGPGGLTDIEWTVQLAQMRHAHDHPDLRVTGTLATLDALVTDDLVAEADAAALRAAFLLASRIRDATMLFRGRASDLVPTNAADLGQLAQVMGYPRGSGSHLDDAWRRISRQAKVVVDRLLWGV